MSAGGFSRSRYESDDDEIHPIRVQPETLTLTIGGVANAAPTGAVTSPISAKVSKGNRGVGLKPRSVTIVFTGTPPTGYLENSPITLPLLTEAAYDAANKGATGSYLGGAIEVISKSPERVG